MAWGNTVPTNTRAGSSTPVIVDVYRYVNEVGEDGWIQAIDETSVRLPLCKYTKVMLLGTKAGRTTFKVVGGTHAGKVLSMKTENANKYLGQVAPKSSIIEVVVTYGKYQEAWASRARGGEKLDQQWAQLSAGGLNSKVTMNTVWDGVFYPIPAGEYLIMVPDVPHASNMTSFYRREDPSLKHDQVWFPIKYGNNSRYIHVGNVSDGCTTVVDLAKWADLHEILISHRSPDLKYVGKLIVKGKPERTK